MVDVILVADSNLVGCMLSEILDTEHDFNLTWCSNAHELDLISLALNRPTVLVICDPRDAECACLLGRFRDAGAAIVIVERDEDLSNCCVSPIFHTTYARLANPLGSGPRAWREFRPALVDTIRKLAACLEHSSNLPTEPGDASECTAVSADEEPIKRDSQGKILVVDDEASMRVTLAAILRAEGYEVATAGTGEETLDIYSQGGLVCVLMDMRMPGIDGLEVFHRLRRYCDSIPVILMSAYASDAMKEAVKTAGAVAFLQKPLDIKRALDLIRSHL